MLFHLFRENRSSGPKGHEDDDVYAGDKSPAYPKTGKSGNLIESRRDG